MIARWFLLGVALLYLGLAAYCTFNPAAASEFVGFALIGGSGDSEFLTIYGGLELWLAMIFALPMLRPEWLSFSVTSCFLLHACLAVFRTAGFLLFDDIGAGTIRLALGEWLILILTTVAIVLNRKSGKQTASESA